MRIAAVDLHYLYVPYRAPVGPYWGWRAPSHGAHAVIVALHTDTGLVGLGETAGRESEFHHRRCAAAVIGMDPLTPAANAKVLRAGGETTAARSGVEMAMWDLLGKSAGLPLHVLLGGRVRERVPLCGLMGVKPPDEAAETAAAYVRDWGFQTIKTKAGRDPDEDLAIARAVTARVGGRAALRIDANEAYGSAEAIGLCQSLGDIPIAYVEQPMDRRDLVGHADLRRLSPIPIALNESVTDSRSVFAIARAGAADALVPDIPTAGGLADLLRVAAVASAAGLPCAFHNWHDLGVKTAAMAHLVSALPAFSLASDTTYHGLEGDVITAPFVISGGAIRAPDGPGLGVDLDRAALDRFRKETIE